MKKRLAIAIILIFAAVILVGCAAESTVENIASSERITQEEAMEWIAHQNVIILDVRNLDEFNMGHIPDAVSLPVDEIQNAAPRMIPDKEQIILVYCQTGRRSANASAMLAEMGYTMVFDFGGIVDWAGEVVTPSH